MTKKAIIDNIKFCIELEGDGGCSIFSQTDKNEMRDFLNKLGEPVDEEELDKLAEQEFPYTEGIEDSFFYTEMVDTVDNNRAKFKMGYRKAFEYN